MNQDISPFSLKNDYSLRWGKPTKKLEESINVISPHQQTVLRRLSVLKYSTKMQLAKQITTGNIRKGKKYIDILEREGFLIRHIIKSKNSNREVPFYSLSNDVLNIFKMDMGTRPQINEITRALVLSQLYIRFSELDENTEVMPFPEPFDLCIKIFKKEFRISAARDRHRLQKVCNHLKFFDENMSTFVILEDLDASRSLLQLKEKSNLFRMITDASLLWDETLEQSFYRLENEWVPETIPMFGIKQKLSTLTE